MCRWAGSYSIMAMNDLKALFRRKTVSSLELVEVLNALRDEGEPRLRYDHFVRKVGQVLGIQAAEGFIVKLPASRGRTRTVYEFPKREACLMVLSYGYKLQAMMFDTVLSGSKRD